MPECAAGLHRAQRDLRGQERKSFLPDAACVINEVDRLSALELDVSQVCHGLQIGTWGRILALYLIERGGDLTCAIAKRAKINPCNIETLGDECSTGLTSQRLIT